MRAIIISSPDEMKSTVEDILFALKAIEDISDEKQYDICLCLRELLQNSLRYSGCDTVRLVYEISEAEFRFSVADNGRGFDFSSFCTCPDVMSESGRGIFLVRELADSVQFNKRGNTVTVKFYY